MSQQPDLSTTMLGRAQRVLAFAAKQPRRATQTMKAVRAHPKMPWIAWPVSLVLIGVTCTLLFKFPLPTTKLGWIGESAPGTIGILINPVFVDLIVYSAETLFDIVARLFSLVRGGSPPTPPPAD